MEEPILSSNQKARTVRGKVNNYDAPLQKPVFVEENKLKLQELAGQHCPYNCAITRLKYSHESLAILKYVCKKMSASQTVQTKKDFITRTWSAINDSLVVRVATGIKNGTSLKLFKSIKRSVNIKNIEWRAFLCAEKLISFFR